MGDLTARIAGLSPEKRALLKTRLRQPSSAELERTSTEPIAVVGIGCRFPGRARSPEAFWRLISEGIDAISETPRDRWNVDELYDPDASAPGKVTTRWGGFVDGVDEFDATLFGIAPREAAQMDPQQRLLLETVWDALEHGGQSPDRLKGTRTGVFVGAHSHSLDYCTLQYAHLDQLDMFSGTGTAHNFLSGRLSYLLDLHGPSLTVDTACSSSLVATHLACQSLRAAECSATIVGGVNLMLTPHFTVAASRMHMLSPSGRCKTFDAAADGFVRSEGCGVVVLKRLSDAVTEGDRVLAIIRGSAVNQDGRTNGITAPNGLSQQDVIRRALRNAGVEPQDVGYVEAHGTGTPLGDPIEVEALAATVGLPRADGGTVVLGSVKSNIGHLEGAAGVAGLIKAILCLHHKQLPPLVHFQRLNPHISLEGSALRIPTSLEAWSSERPRLAGVSSFGWSGTNAHLVLEEAPAPQIASVVPRMPFARVVPISGRTPEALDALARAWRDWCDGYGKDADLADVSDTAARRRAHLDHRVAIIATSIAEIAERLDVMLAGDAHPDVVLGHASDRGGIVFVFPGQGSQWLGMGRELYATEDVFRRAIDELDAALLREVEWSLVKELHADEASSNLARIDVVQPVLFGIEVALAALWRARGVQPDAVVGHSMGEVAAALVAGVLSPADAARVITARSRLLRRVSGRGRMAVLDLSMEDTAKVLAPYAGRLSIAVSNSPTSTVISGDADAVAEVVATLDEQDIFCRQINVDVASHSPHVDPLGPDLARELAELQPVHSAGVPFYSTVAARTMSGRELNAGYWVRNLREPVLLSKTVQQLAADGHTTFIEMSPHPVLLQPIETTLRALGHDGLAVASLRRQESERGVMLSSAARLYAAGYGVDWIALNGRGGFVDIPRYHFQRERFWLESATGQTSARIAGVPDAHPILTGHLDPAERPGSRIWQVALDPRRLRYLLDHRLGGTPVLSASVTLELALAAAAHLFGDGPVLVRDFELVRPLAIPADGPGPTVQVAVTPRAAQEAEFRMFAVGDGTRLLARAVIAPGQPPQANPAAAADDGEQVQPERYYEQLERRGVSIGDTFKTITSMAVSGGSIDAEVALPESAASDVSQYQCHPALTDGLLQLVMATLDPTEGSYVTAGCGEVRWFRRPGVRARARVESVETGDIRSRVRDLQLVDENGIVLELRGLQLRAVETATGSGLPDRVDRWLHEIEWRERPRAQRPELKAPTREGRWLVFADEGGVGKGVADWLTRKGQHVIVVRRAASLASEGGGYVLPAEDADAYTRLLESAFASAEASCRGVVFLWPLDAQDPRERVDVDRVCGTSCGAALHLVRALGRHDWAQAPRLWMATRGAQAVSDAECSPWQATVWGLGRVAAEEHRELFGALIDIDPAAPIHTCVEHLASEVWENDGEPEVAWRQGRRFVPRLVPGKRDAVLSLRCRADAAYVVTGAFGGIGAALSRWLVEQGARRLILVGRTPLPPRQEWARIDPASSLGRRVALVRALESLGASVHVASFDLSDEPVAREFFEQFEREGWPPVRGVIHCAAIADDRLLATMDSASLFSVLRPKAIGAWVLDRVLRDAPLDFFVSFSSLGSLIGQPGQGSYAAANAFLDTFAAHQRQRNLRAIAVNWGGWRGLGFADTEGGRRTVSALEQSGIGSFEPNDALAALRMIIESDATQVAVVPADWSRVRRARAGASELRLLDELGRDADAPPAGTANARERPAPLGAKLAEALPDERRDLLEAHLQDQLARVLRLPVSRLDPAKPLGALGLESLMALEFRNRLERSLGVKLSATLVWNHPTIRALATYLLGRLDFAEPTGAAAVTGVKPAALVALQTSIGELTEEEALKALLGGQD